MPKPVVNIAASVRHRLLQLAHKRGADFQLILIQYAVERLLFRFSRSAYKDRFVLKGAMLFSAWSKEPFRATRDLDFLGKGDNTVSAMTKVFSEICKTAVDGDGLEFLSDKIDGEEIRDEQEYQGARLRFEARLAGARIPKWISASEMRSRLMRRWWNIPCYWTIQRRGSWLIRVKQS